MTIPEIHTGKGMPSNQPVPSHAKFSPRLEIGNPFVHNIVNPLAIVSMASVATNGGTLNFVIAQPLNHPNAAPANNPATIEPVTVKPMNKFAEGISIPFLSNPAVIAPHNASTEPMERSMPAVKTTKVIPTEMQILTEIWRITFHRLEVVKNLSDIILITTQRMNNAISD